MKWLVLSDEIDSSVKFSESLCNSFSDSQVVSSTSRLSKDIVDEIDTFTHVVVDCSVQDNWELAYSVGFLAGSGACIFATADSFSIKLFDFPFVQIFDTFENLSAFVLENAQEIIDEDLRTSAFDFLFENGYPFDADNFARYIEKWKKKICQCYLDAGMSVNSRDSDGTPMLNIASRCDNLTAVKWLVSHGAEINAVSKDRGYSAIMDAVWRGNLEITKYLVKQGAELNTISKEGQTMLILAVGADRTEIVQLLAENGADPDIADSMGMSAYGYASLFKKTEILSILEKYHKEQ